MDGINSIYRSVRKRFMSRGVPFADHEQRHKCVHVIIYSWPLNLITNWLAQQSFDSMQNQLTTWNARDHCYDYSSFLFGKLKNSPFFNIFLFSFSLSYSFLISIWMNITLINSNKFCSAKLILLNERWLHYTRFLRMFTERLQLARKWQITTAITMYFMLSFMQI